MLAAKSRCPGLRRKGRSRLDTGSAKNLQEPLIRNTQPYAQKIAHKGIWAEPELLVEIEFRPKSGRAKSGIRSSRDCGRPCDETHPPI
jgi:hypothetical protein